MKLSDNAVFGQLPTDIYRLRRQIRRVLVAKLETALERNAH